MHGLYTALASQAMHQTVKLADRKKWELMRDDSKFVNWQKVKVQESSDEVTPPTASC